MITEKQYIAIAVRVEELLQVVDNQTPNDDKSFIELELLSNLMADYEDEHHPIGTPKLNEVLRLRMQEMHLTQEQLAEKIGIPPTRLSQYLSNKADPTYKVAQTMCRVLNIHPAIVLGLKEEPNYP